jgi:hypothetical protein
MVNNDNDITCEHAACDCNVESAHDFCSKDCQQAGETVDCECPHDDCSGHNVKPQI